MYTFIPFIYVIIVHQTKSLFIWDVWEKTHIYMHLGDKNILTYLLEDLYIVMNSRNFHTFLNRDVEMTFYQSKVRFSMSFRHRSNV